MLYSIMVLHISTMPRITQKAIGVLLISIYIGLVICKDSPDYLVLRYLTKYDI